MAFFIGASATIHILQSIWTDGVLFRCRPTAITMKSSAARRHLWSQGAIFRGLDFFLLHMLLSVTILTFAKPVVAWGRSSLPRFLVMRLLLGLPLTNLHMAWVHTVISKPNGKSLRQRIPGWREWVRIAPVASADICLPSLAFYFAKYVVILACHGFGHARDDQDCGTLVFTDNSWQNLTSVAVPFLSYLLASAMTRGIYVRVAAGMLPDDVEPVVPFVRTSGRRDCRYSISSLILNSCKTVTGDQCCRYLNRLSDAVFSQIFAFYAVLFLVMIEGSFFSSDFSFDILRSVVDARCG